MSNTKKLDDLLKRKKEIAAAISEARANLRKEKEVLELDALEKTAELLKLGKLGHALYQKGMSPLRSFIFENSSASLESLSKATGLSKCAVERQMWNAEWDAKKLASESNEIRDLLKDIFDYDGFPFTAQSGKDTDGQKIEMNKKYRYRNGEVARILCVNGRLKSRPVYSEAFDGHIYKHAENGRFVPGRDDPADLIEDEK